MIDRARGIVVYRRVRGREPLSNLLLYLVPCGRISVFAIQLMEGDHEHVILSIPLFAFLTSVRTMVQRKLNG